MDEKKKAALIMVLRGKGNGPKDGSGPGCNKKEEEEEHDEDHDEKYEAFGEDLLSAIKSEDKVKVGEVIADIVRSMK